MELRINGRRARTVHVNFYAFGTDWIIEASVKNGPNAVSDARIWTSSTYRDWIGIRLAGAPTWTYPGASSAEGFPLGDLAANEEKEVEIKVNLAAPPGRPGENLIPLRVGHGGT